jgi:D-glycero-D-manno-heptose 1,7-bisphosphate phosphatase
MSKLCAEWTIVSIRGALFLDRDGVIIKDSSYVNSTDRVEFIPECIEAIKVARNSGLYVFVVTNQAGVARKYFTETQCRDFNLWLVQALDRKGARIDELVYCPSHPDFSSNPTNCSCRKPNSGMLDYLVQKWNLNKEKSLILGDTRSDCEAGIKAGINARLVIEPIDILNAVNDFVLNNEGFSIFDINLTS